jgi:hypothetical protein
LLFTWNLSPLQSSKFSFEYLLLPPRSALEAVQAEPSTQPPRPPLSLSHSLQRHPFSGLLDSAGELLQTP